MESILLRMRVPYRRPFIIRAAVMILVLFRDLTFGGALSVNVSLMAAPAVKAVVAAPTSAVHQLWASVLAVSSLLVILVQCQISFAMDRVKFVTKAIIKRIVCI